SIPFADNVPSTTKLLGSVSHCGGMAKENFPFSNFTSEIGRTLPLSPTKYPTRVLIPDNFTSSHEGTCSPPLSTVISHLPIKSFASDARAAMDSNTAVDKTNNFLIMYFPFLRIE